MAPSANATKQLATLVATAGTSLPQLCGLSTRSVAELLVEVGDPRRFTEAGFARFNASAPPVASTAEGAGEPVRHHFNPGGNRRVNAIVEVLNEAGYTRYQERTATILGELSELLRDRWKGDLRRLRREAGRDPNDERRLLKEFKGIGDVGVDIFFREAQAVWPEVRPFFDRRARDGAARVGLPRDADKLAALVSAKDLARLSAALVRVELDDDLRERVRHGA